ncbi:MAG: hypothetical protein ACI4SQ_06375 [Eubacterium sp.]
MKQFMGKVIALVIVVTMLAGVPAMEAQAAGIKYATYVNTRFTYTVKYPNTFQRMDYSSGDGTKLVSKDGKAKATIWNSYGTGSKRNGKTVVATAKKNRKINVEKASKGECSYSYKMGKNTIQYCYVFIKNGEIAFQLTYPTASKKYYSVAAKGMMASLKKNKSLTLND